MFLLPEFPQGYLHLLPLQFRLRSQKHSRIPEMYCCLQTSAHSSYWTVYWYSPSFLPKHFAKTTTPAKRWVKQEVRIPPEYCPTWTLMRWQIRQPPAASLHSPQTPDVQAALKQGCAVLALQLKTPVPVRL